MKTLRCRRRHVTAVSFARRRLGRRWLTAAVVLVAVGGALAPVTAVSAQGADADLAGVDVERYGAADRYATSLSIADSFVERAGGTVDNVVMVSGRHWHDAAVAVPMASALRAPVVMTPPEALRPDTASFLSRVKAKHVIVVASGEWPDTTVSPRVLDQLTEAGAEAFLTHGADRYLTGIAAARWLAKLPGRADNRAPVVIANGETFADAIAAGPLSYALEAPLLLTPRSALHPDVAQYLRDARIDHVVLMGGTTALSEDIETAVRGLGIARVDRIDGATRYHTAAAAARYTAELLIGVCFAGPRIGLARGDLHTDAASAAPLLAQQCTPLLLTGTDRLPDPTAEHLTSLRSAALLGPLTITVFGGPNAIPDQLLNPLTSDPKP